MRQSHESSDFIIPSSITEKTEFFEIKKKQKNMGKITIFFFFLDLKKNYRQQNFFFAQQNFHCVTCVGLHEKIIHKHSYITKPKQNIVPTNSNCSVKNKIRIY